MSYAREIGFAIRQASKNQIIKQQICEGLGISEQELEKLYAGRLFLTGADLDKVAQICGVPVEAIVTADPAIYDAQVVSCMSGFKNVRTEK